MINLLAETIYCIEDHEKETKDIIFIGSEITGHSCSWDEFIILSDRVYDQGFGPAEVAADLIIVFSDGCIMRRREYDGSENWVMCSPFSMPDEKKPIRFLFARAGREYLEEING